MKKINIKISIKELFKINIWDKVTESNNKKIVKLKASESLKKIYGKNEFIAEYLITSTNVAFSPESDLLSLTKSEFLSLIENSHKFFNLNNLDNKNRLIFIKKISETCDEYNFIPLGSFLYFESDENLSVDIDLNKSETLESRDVKSQEDKIEYNEED